MSQIHHYSIGVQDTRLVAKVLHDLFKGTMTGFAPYENSYIIWFGDEHGSAIELYPATTEMFPDAGDGQASFRSNTLSNGFTATHAAISIDRSREEILTVARKNGWKALELSRGNFKVIEFWIENPCPNRVAHTRHGRGLPVDGAKIRYAVITHLHAPRHR